jgi:uncharacterized integral membrane protein
MVLTGVMFALFATQNTTHATINILGYVFSFPLYLIVLGSLLVGLLISGLVSVLNSIATSYKLHSKESTIKEKAQTVDHLSQKVHDLEIDNARLKGKEEGSIDTTHIEERKEVIVEDKNPNIFQRIRHNLSN